MVDPDQLLLALDDEQREVATTLKGPLRVLAGAGTGKTRAITHRIAHGVASGVYKPHEVLAVTFTTKAAGEMRARLRGLGAPGVQARTFHSAALRQLRWFWPKVYGGEPPALAESKLPILGRAAKAAGASTDRAALRDLASEIEWAKVSNIRPEDYPQIADRAGREVSGLATSVVADIFAGYEHLKSEQGRIDMEDVLLVNAALLAEDERAAAAVRAQYKHFVVDEFQDVSPIQQALLDLWLGGRSEICVVGDPAQTIYSFAGARADYLLDFPKRYPGAASVQLVRNYRSTPQIITTANALLAGAPGSSLSLRAQSPSGPELTWLDCPDEPSEAEQVCAEIEKLQARGVPLGEIAILFRINAQSENFEDALVNAGVNYVIRGAARFFERPEVKQAIALLRAGARSAATDDSVTDQVRGVLEGLGWSSTPPAARGQSRDRWESWQAVVSLAESYAEQESSPTLAGFAEELQRRAEEQHAPDVDGVTLATMHTAKGLEWTAVFVCGLHEGTMPFSYADTPEAIEEERRLLYVGITRAREYLYLSWARARSAGGSARREPSRFLRPLMPGAVTAAVNAASSTGKKRQRKRPLKCRTCGSALASPAARNRGYCDDCPVPYDPDVFEALKQWRLETSQAEQVPAYVVFTDATLEALAEVKPNTSQGLLSINGIGPSKLEKYGDEVLTLLSE